MEVSRSSGDRTANFWPWQGSGSGVHAFGSVLLLEVNGQKTSGGAQLVYRSTDGGASWTYVSTAPIQMPIAFVTATRWLVVAFATDGQETTDGGATWHTYPTDYRQAGGGPPQIVFGDANIGYATFARRPTAYGRRRPALDGRCGRPERRRLSEVGKLT